MAFGEVKSGSEYGINHSQSSRRMTVSQYEQLRSKSVINQRRATKDDSLNIKVKETEVVS